MISRAFFALAVLALSAGRTHAADDLAVAQPSLTPAGQSQSFVSEFRFGGYYHELTGREQGSFDVNAELLFAKPFTASDPWIDALLPRPHVGGTFNTGGDTSHLYAGLSWTLNFGQSVFFEATFGGSVNNGDGSKTPASDRNALGCNALFRESASLGYRFTPNWSVMATIEHMSNAGLCDRNYGLTNAGIRLGYQF
jgi:hypothetical protein